MDKAWALIRCAHLAPVVVVTGLTSALAIRAGGGAAIWWLTGAIASGQLAVGWSNDWLDRDRDRAAGRRDKPLAVGHVSPHWVGGAALFALGLCVPFSLLYGILAGIVHLAAVGLALLYNLGLKRSWVSLVPYALGFASIPVVVTLGLAPPHLPPSWMVAAAGLLGSAGHFTQTLPDIPSDRLLSVNGFPQRLGRQGSAYAAFLSLAGAIGFTAAPVILHPIGSVSPISLVSLGWAAALSLGILASVHAQRWNLGFGLTLAAACLVTAVVVVGGQGTS
jgi:4-hydroxybenzoate polyprenyltransferase